MTSSFIKVWDRKTSIWFALACIVPLTFAWFTGHIWEDYFITFKSSANLASGNGLVYHPGERVHTFTSPIGVLLPAAIHYLSGQHSVYFTLWIFRIFSVLAFASGLISLIKFGRSSNFASIPLLTIGSLYLFDLKLTDFAINGMETGFLVFFQVMLIYSIGASSTFRWLKIGVCAALMQWTRPDAFVFVVVIAVSFLVFLPASCPSQTRKQLFKELLWAAAIAALLYAPWIIVSWWYYASPIPNTIVAKSLSRSIDFAELFEKGVRFPLTIIQSPNLFSRAFMPAYANEFGGWGELAYAAGELLTLICMFAIIAPGVSRFTRTFSFCFIFSSFYLVEVVSRPWPWYFPPATILGYLVLASLINDLLDKRLMFLKSESKEDFRQVIAKFCFGFLALFSLSFLLTGAYQLKLQQEIIENQNRTQIGLYLAEAADPGDTIMMECLGYFGFFSGLKTYDYPGLSSKEVVEARKKIIERYGVLLPLHEWVHLIRMLRPDWLILRPLEERVLQKIESTILDNYTPVKKFDKTQVLEGIKFLPGRGYFRIDQSFTVWKRQKNKQTVN